MDTALNQRFAKTALASGIVSQTKLDEALQALAAKPADPPSKSGEVTDSQLAYKLVDMGELTLYQADQLLSGRTRLNLGPYIVTDFIGQGGMGQVFKAEHEVMGREVAVKVLPRDRSTPEAIENFRREIRTQARLDHDHLVRAFDAGHDGNVHFLVTEYVPGTDLRGLVRSQGKLKVRQAAVISQAARGLQYAHDQGLIHRDVKPGNILVTPEGVAKVSDLGLSGNIRDGDDPRAGKIAGTADYLSPEQIRSPGDVGPVSDIYGLGCTLYYAVTGKVPFPGGSAKEKARRHLEETPWHPHRFNSELSEEFVEVIADMMEKDPTKRVASCNEVISRLEPWAGGLVPRANKTLMRSPWTAPPPPNDSDDTSTGLYGEGSDEGSWSADSAVSEASQGTASLVSVEQDTVPARRSKKPPLPSVPQPDKAPKQRSSAEVIAISLAIAVPISFLAGAMLMYLVMALVK